MVMITVNGAKLKVDAPLNKEFDAAAKRLGGRFVWPVWFFDARDEARVRDLCKEIYGTDGLAPADLVTLRIEWKEEESKWHDSIDVRGRKIAEANGRDSGAGLGSGVVLLEGNFGSGGSVKNWTTTVDAGTVVLVRDFPRAAAEKLVAEQPNEKRVYSIEIEKPVFDRSALLAEKERLQVRIAEIDELLKTVS